MQPLYIVHALAFFDPATRFGGPIAQLRRVCRGLAQRGHQVRVVATEGIGPDLPREHCCVVEANTEAVANALGKMLANRRHLPTIGENACRMARERFAFADTIDRIEHMYRKFAGKAA